MKYWITNSTQSFSTAPATGFSYLIKIHWHIVMNLLSVVAYWFHCTGSHINFQMPTSKNIPTVSSLLTEYLRPRSSYVLPERSAKNCLSIGKRHKNWPLTANYRVNVKTAKYLHEVNANLRAYVWLWLYEKWLRASAIIYSSGPQVFIVVYLLRRTPNNSIDCI